MDRRLPAFASRSPMLGSLQDLGFAMRYFPAYHNPHVHMRLSEGFILGTFFIRARCTHLMGEHRWPVQGTALDITHYGQEQEILTDQGPVDVMNLYFDLSRHPLPRVPVELEPILLRMLPLHPSFHNSLSHRVRVDFGNDDTAVDLVCACLDELLAQRPGWRDALTHLLACFLIHCCRIYAAQIGTDDRRQGHHAGWIESVRQRLDATWDKPQHVEELAVAAGVSSGHLCRAFRSYTGRSIIAYIHDRRIERSLLLLRDEKRSVADVAAACGYRDKAQFHRQFRQHLATSPDGYRRRWRSAKVI